MSSKDKKLLGIIIAVDGDISQVGMFSMSNDPHYLWHGDIISGPKVGALLTIHQNEVKIIASVSSEKILDNQNSVKSTEFDNRYRKDSVNRTVYLKTKGVISASEFSVTSEYVPMIGNEVALTTQEELNIIYSVENEDESIIIGKSLLENQVIKLPINSFFASHIGIFGNTGSGKSNTLHKLYIELFRSQYQKEIIRKSKFFLIDFNGEYIGKGMFGLSPEEKKIFKPSTRKKDGDLIPVLEDYIFDADILSILFDARPATQVPFLRNAIKSYKDNISDSLSFAKIEIGLLKQIIKGTNDVSADALENWIKAAEHCGIPDSLLDALKTLYYYNTYGNQTLQSKDGTTVLSGGQITDDGMVILRINDIENELSNLFDDFSPIRKLSIFLDFQKVYVSAWKSTNIEHINPLFKRIESAFSSLEKVITVQDNIDSGFATFNIISLVDTNREITRMLPMLLSKMIYDNHKSSVYETGVTQTCHLIVDEAHNILNSEYHNVGDDWQDYRLSVFEEIIKEGRKFGFFLTLASQRPADISPTILSQAHNYFVHRLVNEKDLRTLENTMPTLDRGSYMMIPKLGKGECIVTGTAVNIPIMVKINHEKTIRPNSDDIVLTDLWKEQKQDGDGVEEFDAVDSL